MLSHDMMKLILADREREILTELRRRRLFVPSKSSIRWHHRPDSRQPERP